MPATTNTRFAGDPHWVTIHRTNGDHVRRYLGIEVCEAVAKIETVPVTIETDAEYKARRADRLAAAAGAAA